MNEKPRLIARAYDQVSAATIDGFKVFGTLGYCDGARCVVRAAEGAGEWDVAPDSVQVAFLRPWSPTPDHSAHLDLWQ